MSFEAILREGWLFVEVGDSDQVRSFLKKARSGSLILSVDQRIEAGTEVPMHVPVGGEPVAMNALVKQAFRRGNDSWGLLVQVDDWSESAAPPSMPQKPPPEVRNAPGTGAVVDPAQAAAAPLESSSGTGAAALDAAPVPELRMSTGQPEAVAEPSQLQIEDAGPVLTAEEGEAGLPGEQAGSSDTQLPIDRTSTLESVPIEAAPPDQNPSDQRVAPATASGGGGPVALGPPRPAASDGLGKLPPAAASERPLATSTPVARTSTRVEPPADMARSAPPSSAPPSSAPPPSAPLPEASAPTSRPAAPIWTRVEPPADLAWPPPVAATPVEPSGPPEPSVSPAPTPIVRPSTRVEPPPDMVAAGLPARGDQAPDSQTPESQTHESQPPESQAPEEEGAAAPSQRLGETLGASTYFEIKALNPSQRILLASRANRQQRALLLRDGSPSVQMALVSNPQVDAKEVLELVKNPQTSGGVLQRIALDRRFSGQYDLQLALVKNPRTPSPVAIRFLDVLRLGELRVLAKSQALRENVRRAALRLYLTRSQQR